MNAATRKININRQLIFYHVLGHTLTQWAHVEWALTEILCVPDTGIESLALRRSFLELSLTSKLDFITVMIQTYAPMHSNRWGDIKKDILGKSKMRNKMAHWHAVLDKTDRPKEEMRIAPWFELGGNRDEKSLNTFEIYQARFKFFSVLAQIRNFAAELKGLPPVFDKKNEIPLEATQQMLEQELDAMCAEAGL